MRPSSVRRRSRHHLDRPNAQSHHVHRGSWQYIERESGESYWFSGPRRDGNDRKGNQPGSFPIEIDEDVRIEYWRDIRGLPDRVGERLTRGRLPLLGEARGVCVEAFGQLARTAQGDIVAAVHLVSLDAKARASVPPRPRGREHAVVAAQEVPGRRVWP
jgi:hypothetical protein